MSPDRTSSTGVVGWLSDQVSPRIGDRDTVLVWAADPVRSALAELVQGFGYEVRAPATPLEAIDALIDAGDRISHALLSLDVELGLREFLADEYPAIECVTLDE
jgi:hypothetical protein